MLVLPIILRLLARFEGIPSRSGLELSVMERFFGFQVIHSFLVVSCIDLIGLLFLSKDLSGYTELRSHQGVARPTRGSR